MSSRRHFISTALLSTLFAKLGFAKQSKPQPIVTPEATGFAGHAPLRWNPANTWVFAVGVLVYPDGEAWPQIDRRDAVMIEQLRKAGVPDRQVHFIRDKAATRQNIEKSFAEFLSRAPRDAVLWFYFAGHGDKNDAGIGQFVLYDGDWSFPDVLASVERFFPGSHALLYADCCYSGSLCLEAMARAGRVSFGVLASSMSSSISTNAWTFTNCLIEALSGSALLDIDDDGVIDFKDLVRFTERELAFNDAQLSTYSVANGFDPHMILMPCTKRTHPGVGEYVLAKAKDGHKYRGRIESVHGSRYLIKWVGRDQAKNEMVAEADLGIIDLLHHEPGTSVRVKWKDQWYEAEVITSRLGMHLIHYKGFNSSWDEWVDEQRLKIA